MGNPRSKKAQARVDKHRKLRRDRATSLESRPHHSIDAEKAQTVCFERWMPYWQDYTLSRRARPHSPLARFISTGYGTSPFDNAAKLVQLYLAFWAKTGSEVPSFMLNTTRSR